MRLAKKFGTPSSAAFINALLDALYKEKIGEKVDQAVIKKAADDLANAEDLSKKAGKP